MAASGEDPVNQMRGFHEQRSGQSVGTLHWAIMDNLHYREAGSLKGTRYKVQGAGKRRKHAKIQDPIRMEVSARGQS
jgi:hypothetical protein